MDDPMVDEFAQTRGDDDLFDDEIVPISAAQQQEEVQAQAEVQAEEDQQGPNDVIAPEPEKQDKPIPQAEAPRKEDVPSPTPSSERRTRGGNAGRGRDGDRGGARGRGRGRGGAGRGRGGHGGERPAQQNNHVGSETPVERGAQNGGADAEAKSAEGKGDETTATTDDTKSQSGGTDKAPTNGPETPRVQAVRGDRSGTGGVRKPKLTEDQLSQRMAAAKLKAAELSAAHARAEADEASFQEREKIALEKRRAENQNRRIMDNERERNRLRKLGAQTGREWDAEKKEEDFSGRPSGGSAYRRGAHGGVAYDGQRGQRWGNEGLESSRFADPGPDSPQRGGRRGGRSRGGRGRGRGGRADGGDSRDSHTGSPAPSSSASAPTRAVDVEKDFPSLPSAPAAKTEAAKDLEREMSPITPGGTWADQVESGQ